MPIIAGAALALLGLVAWRMIPTPPPRLPAPQASGASGGIMFPPDRMAAWNPGVGGIPVRTKVCATLDAAGLGNGASDASGAIQKAIDACPAGQVLELGAGTFRIDKFLLLNRGITVRGAGPTRTILRRENGAKPHSYVAEVAEPIIVVGPNRWPRPDETSARDLTADGAQGATSVSVKDASGISTGSFVLIDEDDFDTGAWMSLPDRAGKPAPTRIWASDRVVWQRHEVPAKFEDDPFPDAASWFSRKGRPINEIKEVVRVEGNTVTFKSPLSISYRTSHRAQLTRYTGENVHVRDAGIEDLTVSGGGEGNIRFECAAYSWVKNVEDTLWLGEGVAINNSDRIEVRGSYIHDGVWPQPGGGGYAISLASGSSDVLIEDNIVIDANKMMVARSAGASSVVGYNYMDDGHILTAPSWQEVGINASHMAGSHHVLFEGNESFNYDADCTHGNAIYDTIFRNHLTGSRRNYPEDKSGGGNARTAGLEFGAWWHTFVGNVLGTQGKMGDWQYESLGGEGGRSPFGHGRFLWKLGYDPAHWDQGPDPKVLGTVIRHGNFDFLTGKVAWDPAIASHELPASLYLKEKPAFFKAGKGYEWPWVDPTGPVPLHTLPARARYDAGTPFVQP